MIQLSVFFVVVFLVSITAYFIYEERNREKRSKYLYGKALMAYRQDEYYQAIKFLKKGLIIPNTNFINQSEASINLKYIELTELILLHMGVDGEELIMPLRKYLTQIKGVEVYEVNELQKLLMVYDELMQSSDINPSTIMHITRSHLKVHRNESSPIMILQQSAV